MSIGWFWTKRTVCNVLLGAGLVAAATFFPTSCSFAGEEPSPASDADLEASVKRGEKNFRKLCQTCHGPRGRGDGPLAVAISNLHSLTISSTQSKSDEELRQLIAKSKAPMPNYEKKLSEEERQDLVNFIRALAK